MLNFLQQFGDAACEKGGFFGIPTWHKYLDLDPECRIPAGFDPLANRALFWDIFKALIDMGLYVGGIIAIVMIMWGGFKMIISQGNPESINEARKTMLFAIIGLVVSISARVIMGVVEGIFA